MSTENRFDVAAAAGFIPAPNVNLDQLPPGATFQVIWSFTNIGLTTWDSRYRFAYTPTPHPEVTGWPNSQMAAQPSYAITELGAPATVPPGSTIHLTLTLTVPTTITTHASTWQLRAPDGQPIGPVRWLRAVVKDASADAPQIITTPEPPQPEETPPVDQYIGPPVQFAAGIHGPGDAFTWHDPGFRQMMSRLNIPVKFMSDGDRSNWYREFRKPVLELVRVFWKPDRSRRKTAHQAWIEDMRDGVMNFYRLGARDFEVHNEPRLPQEGMGHQWHNGAEFGDFLRQLMLIIKNECPEARLWYPGESPGVPWTDQFAFTHPAYEKVADLCYGVCQHAYSGNVTQVAVAVAEIVEQARAFHGALGAWDKPIIISECSVNRAAAPEFRARVYTKIAQELRQIPGIKGVFWYISHWNAPPDEVANQESWYGTTLPDHYKQLNP